MRQERQGVRIGGLLLGVKERIIGGDIDKGRDRRNGIIYERDVDKGRDMRNKIIYERDIDKGRNMREILIKEGI